MLEAIARIAQLSGRRLDWHYVEEAYKGDHIRYISNLRKFQAHSPLALLEVIGGPLRLAKKSPFPQLMRFTGLRTV
jgi:hypothetical protein